VREFHVDDVMHVDDASRLIGLARDGAQHLESVPST